jgi:hypothetical protein
VLCPAARCRGIANSRAVAVATSGSITRCSEREVAVLCHLVRTSLKMSKQSTSDSFYTELFSVDKKNQLDVTFCILYFSSNSCSTCFGQPCAHHQELTTA